MKNVIRTLAFVMLLGIVVIGCKKNESKSIVGNWKIDSYSYVYNGGSDLIPELVGKEWYFSGDGTLTGFFEGWVYGQYLYSKYGFDYVDEHEEEFEQFMNGGTLKTNYTYNNSVLTIEGGDLIARYVIYDLKSTSEYVTKTMTFTYTLDVEHINGNSMVLTGDFVTSERYSNNPKEDVETETVKIILTKN